MFARMMPPSDKQGMLVLVADNLSFLEGTCLVGAEMMKRLKAPEEFELEEGKPFWPKGMSQAAQDYFMSILRKPANE